MQITKTVDGSAVMLSLKGRLDGDASLLERELDSLGTISDLVLDLEELEGVTSSGLRLFLVARSRMNGKGTLTLIHVPSSVRELFAVTGLEGRLNIL